jgi:membrane protease YdiL (CAAX protease family)
MTVSDDSIASAGTEVPIGVRQVLVAPAIGTALGFAAFFVLAILIIVGGHVNAADPAKLTEALQSNFYIGNVTLVAFYAPLLWWLWKSTAATGVRPLAKFFPPVGARTVLLALASGVLFSTLCFAAENYLASQFKIDFGPSSPFERTMFPTTPLQLVLSVFVIGGFGPFVEEFYFRGILLSWLRQKLSQPLAIVLSALAFSAVHLFPVMHPGAAGWIDSAEIFVAGLLMALWVTRTGSLWASFALHFGYNSTVAVQMFLSPN